eukprot:760400-Hanusia_phi.AAC.3
MTLEASDRTPGSLSPARRLRQSYLGTTRALPGPAGAAIGSSDSDDPGPGYSKCGSDFSWRGGRVVATAGRAPCGYPWHDGAKKRRRKEMVESESEDCKVENDVDMLEQGSREVGENCR